MITRYSRMRYDGAWTAAIFPGGPLQFRRYGLTDERFLYLTRINSDQAALSKMHKVLRQYDIALYEQNAREISIYNLVFQFWSWFMAHYWQDSK